MTVSNPCPSCEGTGQVAPSPWVTEAEPRVPWARYVAEDEERRRERGLPASSSAILAGLLRPVACPDCVSLVAAVVAPPPEPTATVEAEAQEWCLLYASSSGDACGQSITGVMDDLPRSDCEPCHFARWPSRAAVVAWMSRHRLEHGVPTPFGVGLYPTPVMFLPGWLARQPHWFRGALYLVKPRRSPAPGEATDADPIETAVADAMEASAINSRHATGGARTTKAALARRVAAEAEAASHPKGCLF